MQGHHVCVCVCMMCVYHVCVHMNDVYVCIYMTPDSIRDLQASIALIIVTGYEKTDRCDKI